MASSNAAFFAHEEIGLLARYVFELTRLGAAYMIEESAGRGGWYVTVTGF
jgi:hypothetical protein